MFERVEGRSLRLQLDRPLVRCLALRLAEVRCVCPCCYRASAPRHSRGRWAMRRVIVASAYTLSLTIAGTVGALRKPFALAELLAMVEHAPFVGMCSGGAVA